MFRYLPILAVITVILNIVLIIYRINHWTIDSTLSWSAWILLGILEVIMIYYTWHKANDIAVTSMIMWTVGLLFVPILIIPWWFLRIYPAVRVKLS